MVDVMKCDICGNIFEGRFRCATYIISKRRDLQVDNDLCGVCEQKVTGFIETLKKKQK